MKEKTIRHHISKKLDDKDDLKKESFVATVSVLKNEAQKQDVIITDADIAKAANITEDQFRAYFENDNAPNELFLLLRSKYNNILGNTTHYRIFFADSFLDPLESEEPEEE